METASFPSFCFDAAGKASAQTGRERRSEPTPASLFAVWAADILPLANTPGLLPDSSALIELLATHEYMAMEAAALPLAADFKIPCLLADSFLSIDELGEIKAGATAMADAWYDACGETALANMLREEMTYHFRVLHTARALADKWKKAGIVRLSCLQPRELEIDGLWGKSDLALAVWADLLPGVYNPIVPGGEAASPARQSAADRAKNLLARKEDLEITRFLADGTYGCIKDAALFITGHGILRSHKILKQTREAGLPVAMFVSTGIDINRGEVPAWAAAFKLPMHVKEHSAEVDALVARLCGLLPGLPRAQSLLKEYLAGRCAALQGLYSRFRKILAANRPKIICVEHCLDTPFRVCLQAGLDAGLPVVTYPHAAASYSPYMAIRREDNHVMALSSKLSEEACIARGLGIRTATVKNIFEAHEYRMETRISIHTDKPVVLFVVSTSQLYPKCLYFDGPANRLRLLKALCAPPDGLAEKCDYFFKLHPVWSEKELYPLAGIAQNRVLPLDSDLLALLPQTTVLVTINYGSSPTVMAVEAGVPVIQLSTYSSGAQCTNGFEKTLLDKGLLKVSSADECWKVINKIISSGEYAAALAAEQKKQLETAFRTDDAGWGDLVKRLAENPKAAKRLRFMNG